MSDLKHAKINPKIIGASFEVHKFLGNSFQLHQEGLFFYFVEG
jgi:hypothetical protein